MAEAPWSGVAGRRTRRLRTARLPAAVLLALVIALLGPGAGWTPAAVAIDPARGTPGPCTDDAGVTVVVDFQGLGAHGGHGGGVIVRCAHGSGLSGLDALHHAGFEITGTSRWGQGFVCRLEGRPAPDEPLPVSGNEGYTEPCVDTPPAQAFWSYWHAQDGGPWVFSQLGAKNRTVPAGTFEGWSFSLNSSASNNPAPRFAPHRQAARASPEPVPGGVGDADGSGEGGPITGSRTDSAAGGVPASGATDETARTRPPGNVERGEAAGTSPGHGVGASDDPRPGATAKAAPPLPRAGGTDGTGTWHESAATHGSAGETGAAVTEDPGWSGGEQSAAAVEGTARGAPVSLLASVAILALLGSLAAAATRRRRSSA